jgi:hypothetical protein
MPYAMGTMGSGRLTAASSKGVLTLKIIFGAAAAAFSIMAAPAYAVTESFAQYEQIDEVDTISFDLGLLSDTGGRQGSLVLFNFLETQPAPIDGQIQAYMNFTAAPSGGYGGTLSFLRVGDLANLLTVNFGNALLVGGGGSGSFLDSQPGLGTVSFTSAFLDFSQTTEANFSLSFSAINPFYGSSSWTADSVGTFAANNVGGGTGVIPEPGTWALMIMGFGAAGAVLRRRRVAMA